MGHRVDLATYHVGEEVDLDRVQLHRIPRVPFIKHVKVGPSWAKGALDILLFFRVILLLLTNRYDVIHSHEEAAFFAMVLGKLFRTPHLYDMHSSLPRQLENFRFGNWWWMVKAFRLLERWVLRTCDAVITIGDDLSAYVGQINPKLPCTTIHNIALHMNGDSRNCDRPDQLRGALGLDSARPIIYTGTFEPYQGLDLLIESANLVVARFPKARFLLVGGNNQQIDQLKSVVQARGLDEVVTFTGIVPPQTALDYLDLAEVLVSPRTEGTSVPLKIYSYLHAGKPIVATDLPAHTQILEDGVALLVKPTSEAIAEGICFYLADPDCGRKMGADALALAQQKYSYETYVARVENIYQKLGLTADSRLFGIDSESPLA
jgi:glycosyltransferase involved in cell wall biosynthesis